MMPSLLPALEEGDIIRPKTTAASPLIISFQEGWAPTGLFCALVVSLLSRKSQLPWKISELVIWQHVKAVQKQFGVFNWLYRRFYHTGEHYEAI